MFGRKEQSTSETLRYHEKGTEFLQKMTIVKRSDRDCQSYKEQRRDFNNGRKNEENL